MKRASLSMVLLGILALLALAFTALASADTPSKLMMGFVPSQNADTLAETAAPLANMLSEQIGIPVEAFVSANYTGLAESMASKKVDIGFLAPFSYVLAHDQLGAADVILKSVRYGSGRYRAQFFARAGLDIKSVVDLKGKKFAFVDPASTSGYLFPAAYMKDHGIDPDEDLQAIFAGGHDTTVVSVYRGDVDAGVSFEDARTRLEKEYPDVMDKVVVFGYTDWIPNDTVSVRPGLDADLVAKIKAAFKSIAETDAGHQVLTDIYEIDGFADATDQEYDVIRRTAALMGVTGE